MSNDDIIEPLEKTTENMSLCIIVCWQL